MNKETIVVLDFGGQYNQLIARRVREAGVYCEMLPYNTSIDELKEKNLKGIIFSGGPNSVYEKGAPQLNPDIFIYIYLFEGDLHIKVLSDSFQM